MTLSPAGDRIHRSLLFILALAMGIALLAFPSGSAAAADTGSISGVLTTSGSSPPAAFCLLTAQAYDSNGDPAGSDNATADGYVIDELEPGDYRVGFRSGCVRFENGIVVPAGDSFVEYYDDEASLATAETVTVTAGSDTGDIDAHLGPGQAPPRGSISGTTTDSSGAVLNNVCVAAFDSDGARQGATVMADGDYSIRGLASGDYRIRFSHCRNYGNNVLTEYYDDVETLAAATPVSVVDRADTPNIDAQLDPAGSISGTATDSAGDPLHGLCVQAFASDGGPAVGYDETSVDGRYFIGGLETGVYQVKFSDCLTLARPPVIPEFYDDSATLAEATPVGVTEGSATAPINAQLTTTPTLGPEPPAPDPVARAAISELSVKGPAKVKRDRKAVYRVKITNSGNAEATGVKLKAKGRGVSFDDSVGAIPAGTTEKVRAKVRPQQRGKVELTFEVTSENAGAQSAERRLTVRR